jgi:signal transduction histidine kinase
MIQQVLMNLSINACEAMPEGGLLVVETAGVEMDAAYAARHPGANPGHYAVLSVSDTGIGMDEATRSRLFEPFFTTKDGGLGLGLAISYEIVQLHGGRLTVDSEPGHGATFTVWLPLAAPPIRD